MNCMQKLATLALGGNIMTQAAAAAAPDVATEPRIDPQVRSFLAKINNESSPFWELSWPQRILTALQEQIAVDLSGECRRVGVCALSAR
jgi:acetyl esterase